METVQTEAGVEVVGNKKKLRNKLPINWMGHMGFRGNYSGSPKYITDGHCLLLNSAVLEDIHITQDKFTPLQPPSSIEELWLKKIRQPSRKAFFCGCGTWKDGEPVAVLFDLKALIYVDPYKLSFCLQAVAADSMEVSKVEPAQSPVIFYREANPVGLLCPMTVLGPGEASLPERYDLENPMIVPIQFALARKEKA